MAIVAERLDKAYRETRDISLHLRNLHDLVISAPATEHRRVANKLANDYEGVRRSVLEGLGIIPVPQ